MDQCPVRLEGGNRIEFLFRVGVFNCEDAALFRDVTPIESANWLEGNAVGCGPQPSKYAGSGVFGEACHSFLYRLSIVRRQSEFRLECNNAADDFLHGACGAKEISVVTGRWLDEREVPKARARHFAYERGGRSVQKCAAGTDRVSLLDEGCGFSQVNLFAHGQFSSLCSGRVQQEKETMGHSLAKVDVLCLLPYAFLQTER